MYGIQSCARRTKAKAGTPTRNLFRYYGPETTHPECTGFSCVQGAPKLKLDPTSTFVSDRSTAAPFKQRKTSRKAHLKILFDAQFQGKIVHRMHGRIWYSPSSQEHIEELSIFGEQLRVIVFSCFCLIYGVAVSGFARKVCLG